MNAQESTNLKRQELTRGYYALLDAEDYEFARRFKWRAVTKGKWTYAYGSVDGEDVFMHRALLKAKPGEQVHHENSNGSITGAVTCGCVRNRKIAGIRKWPHPIRVDSKVYPTRNAIAIGGRQSGS